jgi:ribonuclease HI
MAKKTKFYVVWQGHKPGIYTSWPEAKAQIDGFAGARYKSYPTRAEAERAQQAGPPASSRGGQRRGKAPKAVNSRQNIIWRSLSVDAACSGNPGPMEYQGVDTRTKEQIFHQKFPLGTNNIGEFLAIVHGLALLQKQNLPDYPIYTD